MTSPDLLLRIHQTALLIEGLPDKPGPPSAELDAMFADLRESSAGEHEDIEPRIWEAWCGHEDGDAEALMGAALAAMNDGELGDAETLLDGVVESHPDWAEPWNKRATLYFVLGRDAESVDDIRRTLVLEPRHFGALCGFAQIAVRNGDAHAARVALERAIVVHPCLPGIPAWIERLDETRTPSLH